MENHSRITHLPNSGPRRDKTLPHQIIINYARQKTGFDGLVVECNCGNFEKILDWGKHQHPAALLAYQEHLREVGYDESSLRDSDISISGIERNESSTD